VSGPRTAPNQRPAALLPAEDARDGALVFIVAVLCFLACLSVVAALAADRAAHGWRTELKGSATVVVRPGPDETADAAAARAAEALAGVSGVDEVEALEKDKAEQLLEPWIGRDALRVLKIIGETGSAHHLKPFVDADKKLRRDDTRLDGAELQAFDLP